MKIKNIKIIGSLIVYLVFSIVSYNLFSGMGMEKSATPTTSEKISDKGNDFEANLFDQSAPKTEECPMNGAMYSKEQREWWEKHRPLGVMIENHAEARPQSGISFADVTYEAVAEGGITRTLNVYYCQDAGIVGPIRSARTYFLDFISEYGDYPLYAHVGGANTPGPANALGQIEDFGWAVYNDLNQFSIGYPTYWRDQNRLGHDTATEHTMYSTTTKLWALGEKRKLTNVDKKGDSWDMEFQRYKFRDVNSGVESGKAASIISLEFWNNSDYIVSWKFDKKANLYMRENGGRVHIDRNTNEQLGVSNVIVLFMKERHADDGYEGNAHLLYGTKGQGKAIVYMGGREIKGIWKKDGRTSRLRIYDSIGEEIEFSRGKLWFEILPTDSVVNAM